MKDTFFISAYDAENDCRLYLAAIQPDVNGNVEAIFTHIVCASKVFDSLADAQAFCKVLVSNYVKSFKYGEDTLPTSIKSTLEVTMCYVDCHGNYMRPFPIWSINQLNNNEVFVV